MQRVTQREAYILRNTKKKMLVLLGFITVITITSFVQFTIVDRLKGNVWIEGEEANCAATPLCPTTNKEYSCFICYGKNAYRFNSNIVAADSIVFTLGIVLFIYLSFYCMCCNCCRECVTPNIIVHDMTMINQEPTELV